MKNIKYFLLSFLIIVLFPKYSFAQTGEHIDQYLIPPMEDSCFANPFTSWEKATFSSLPGIDSMLFIGDFSQPYYVDSIVNVIGIAALWGYVALGDMIAYLCIADDTLGIIKRVPVYSEYDTVDGIIQSKDLSDHYTEIIFDSAINVNGLFHIMTDMPKPPSYSPNIYQWRDNDVYYRGDNLQRLAGLMLYNFTSYPTVSGYMPDCLDTNFNASSRTLYFIKNNGEYVLKQPANDYFVKDPLYEYAYLFPILQKTDTTITDSSSLVNIVDNYTFIFPNPVTKEVNVQCSFRMQMLELFNEQGQKVNEWKVDSYHYLLNVEDYPKGNYVMKIKTKSGTATKKLIIQ
jgi:hypothetical protein